MTSTYRKVTLNEAESVAVAAFTYLTADEERLSRFLALSGLSADSIRSAASAPGFFAAILDYVASDEPLLLDLAKELNTKPERIMEARWTLSPSEFE
ncbi:DUF3572 domain-containing protein [Microvirga alba]|uniref:DUF3572 domain-containing protein n=1 Tax=Microvirga alba TaxID=2791025 RepID=A0A931FNJ0_9HYPH|nr:DUF3572 domain-containing protein [Microvirga alba]MBF9234079.1 DUF3572 domain-containing protein [Microvirga alba]